MKDAMFGGKRRSRRGSSAGGDEISGEGSKKKVKKKKGGGLVPSLAELIAMPAVKCRTFDQQHFDVAGRPRNRQESSCDEASAQPTRLGAMDGSKGGKELKSQSRLSSRSSKGRKSASKDSGKCGGSAKGSKIGLQLEEDDDVVPKELAPPYKGWISSFAEGKSLGLCVKQPRRWINHNQHFFSRIYPKGTRVDSSNYNPCPMFAIGAHMVALNYQVNDLGLQLNGGYFRLNGSCGYVLKPAWLRIPGASRGKMLADESGSKVAADKNSRIAVGPERCLTMPMKVRKVSIQILGGTFLIKQGEQRKRAEIWMQPEARDAADKPRCKLLPKKGYQASNADVADPFVVVRVYGGKLAGAAELTKEVIHGKEFKTRAIAKNGLRPRWNQGFELLASHPELALLHIEVRTGKTGKLGYEVLPLNAMQDGYRNLSLRDIETGARLHFSQLQLRIKMEQIATPDRFVPLASLLNHLHLDSYFDTFEQRHRDDLSELVRRHAASEEDLVENYLSLSASKGGVGMTKDAAERFALSLPSWAERLQTEWKDAEQDYDYTYETTG